jgi:hypothetical protein
MMLLILGRSANEYLRINLNSSESNQMAKDIFGAVPGFVFFNIAVTLRDKDVVAAVI